MLKAPVCCTVLAHHLVQPGLFILFLPAAIPNFEMLIPNTSNVPVMPACQLGTSPVEKAVAPLTAVYVAYLSASAQMLLTLRVMGRGGGGVPSL